MKKRTVITTEKREVWIVRWPSSDLEDRNPANEEGESTDSLALVSDQEAGIDTFTDEHEYRGNKGVQE
jgi:hypothetical protein